MAAVNIPAGTYFIYSAAGPQRLQLPGPGSQFVVAAPAGNSMNQQIAIAPVQGVPGAHTFAVPAVPVLNQASNIVPIVPPAPVNGTALPFEYIIIGGASPGQFIILDGVGPGALAWTNVNGAILLQQNVVGVNQQWSFMYISP